MQKPALSLRLHGHDKSHPLREGGTQTRDPRVFTSSGGWGGGGWSPTLELEASRARHLILGHGVP